MRFEVCVDSVAGVLAAQEGGADRVELCSGLLEGGVTPSLGLVEAARAAAELELVVLVRPRGGDFVYDAAEDAVVLADLKSLVAAGVDGVAIGALLPDGRLDRKRMERWIGAAGPMRVTFHRAFDLAAEPELTLDELIDVGCSRLLTSGQEATALDGAPLIARLRERAAGRLDLIAAGGIRAHNAAEVRRLTGAEELHFTAFRNEPSPMRFRRAGLSLGAASIPEEYARRTTQSELVRAVREACR